MQAQAASVTSGRGTLSANINPAYNSGPMPTEPPPDHILSNPQPVVDKHFTFPKPGRYSFCIRPFQRAYFHVGTPGKYSFEALYTVMPGKRAFRMTETVHNDSVQERERVEDLLCDRYIQARHAETQDQRRPEYWAEALRVKKKRTYKKASRAAYSGVVKSMVTRYATASVDSVAIFSA